MTDTMNGTMTKAIYVPATIAQRLGAWLADGMLFIALVAVPSVLISWWFGPEDFTTCTFVGGSEVCSDPTPEALRYTRTVFYGLSSIFILVFSVYVGRGRTIGKRSTEAMIVDAKTGDTIGFVRGLIRTLSLGLSAFPLGAGFLLAFTNRERRMLHDYIAGTRVISP